VLEEAGVVLVSKVVGVGSVGVEVVFANVLKGAELVAGVGVVLDIRSVEDELKHGVQSKQALSLQSSEVLLASRGMNCPSARVSEMRKHVPCVGKKEDELQFLV
jgi:hypothetical protein